MANRIKLKRSAVSGKIPLAADLEIGEIAVNTADAVLYTKHSDNTIKVISNVAAYLEAVTLDSVTAKGSTSSSSVQITNTTASTSKTTGALTVAGGLGVAGNIHVSTAFVDSIFFSNGDPFISGASTSSQTTGNTNIYNGRVTVGTSATLIDTVPVAGANSVKWAISSHDNVNNKYKSSTVDTLNNGTTAYYSEYGIVLSDPQSEVTAFTSNISNGYINLYAVGDSANVSVTYQRTVLGSSTTEGYVEGAYYLQNVIGSGSATNCVVDTFTGNGVQTSFTLTSAPENKNQTLVSIGGILQPKTVYSLNGATLTLSSAPSNGVGIEVISFITTTITGYTGSAGAIGTSGPRGYTGSAGGAVGYFGSAGGGSVNGNLNIAGDISISGNIVPSANVTYSLGTPSNRFKDLYLSSNTLYLGNAAFSADNIFPFNLDIQPEALNIQVQATDAGDDITWQWSWVQSTLPYARATITNQFQASVPLYKEGTYQIDNFAGYEMFGNMDQTHKGYFKWVEGAGLDNLVSWASTYTSANVSNPNINSGNITQVQRYNIEVPSTITPPTLTPPNITYDVSVDAGKFMMGGMAGEGYNVALGPIYRGGTYTFNLDASLAGHPFYLTTDNGSNFTAGSYFGEFTSGVTGSRNDGSVGKTTLVFHVPMDAPDSLFYQCGNHASMRGAITIKNLAVETNINGNYVIYFQHMHEGHKTPIELRPIPAMVNQMCVVYDANTGKFVPQDMATYVENTPSFKNKIREVAGTATLIAPNGVAVVPTVLVVEDTSYLPLVNNKEGDIAFDAYYNTMYVWSDNAWRSTKSSVANGYTGSAGAIGYTGSAGQAGAIGYTGSAGTGGGAAVDFLLTKSDFPGTLTVFNGVNKFYSYSTSTIKKAQIYATVPPVGSAVTVQVKLNGAPVANISLSSGTEYSIQTLSVPVTLGDYLTMDVTSIGSTYPGKDLTVQLIAGS